jgi:hypothetical protein
LTTVGDDGRYAFQVPLVYGTNPVEVIGYGPTGEVRRFGRTFEVPFERLPARGAELEEVGHLAGGALGERALARHHQRENRVTHPHGLGEGAEPRPQALLVL